MIRKTINIFIGTNLLGNILYRNVWRQWQLDNKSINIVVVVHVIDVFHQTFFADGIRKPHHRVVKTDALAGFHFVVNICLASTIITDQNNSEMRNLFPLLLARGYLYSNLTFYIGRYFFSVYKCVRSLKSFLHGYNLIYACCQDQYKWQSNLYG